MTNIQTATAAPDLLFGTPLSIVVRARAEFADGSQSSDIGLVIPRQHCLGDRPSQRALQVAARASLRRLNGAHAGRRSAVRRLLICVHGEWQPLITVDRPAVPAGHFRLSHAGLSLVAS